MRWFNAALPLVLGFITANCIAVSTWDECKQGLLVALSVIAAGVLVRLARGLPFTTPDHYELDEVRKLTAAVRQIIRSLRILVRIVLSGMIILVLAHPLISYITQIIPEYALVIEKIISGVLGAILTYVLLRMLQVVKGDQDFTELQSQFIVRAVERRQGKKFEEQTAKTSSEFKNPEGYGRQI